MERERQRETGREGEEMPPTAIQRLKYDMEIHVHVSIVHTLHGLVLQRRDVFKSSRSYIPTLGHPERNVRERGEMEMTEWVTFTERGTVDSFNPHTRQQIHLWVWDNHKPKLTIFALSELGVPEIHVRGSYCSAPHRNLCRLISSGDCTRECVNERGRDGKSSQQQLLNGGSERVKYSESCDSYISSSQGHNILEAACTLV